MILGFWSVVCDLLVQNADSETVKIDLATCLIVQFLSMCFFPDYCGSRVTFVCTVLLIGSAETWNKDMTHSFVCVCESRGAQKNSRDIQFFNGFRFLKFQDRDGVGRGLHVFFA